MAARAQPTEVPKLQTNPNIRGEEKRDWQQAAPTVSEGVQIEAAQIEGFQIGAIRRILACHPSRAEDAVDSMAVQAAAEEVAAARANKKHPPGSLIRFAGPCTRVASNSWRRSAAGMNARRLQPPAGASFAASATDGNPAVGAIQAGQHVECGWGLMPPNDRPCETSQSGLGQL